MSDDILSSLPEAKAAFRKHAAEQRQGGRLGNPEAWLSLSKDRLIIVVYGDKDGKPVTKPYEYHLEFACDGVHEITAPPLRNGNGRTRGGRKKEEPAKRQEPPRQLHMFRPG